MTEKYNMAINRLNQGLIRKTKFVRRSQKGLDCRPAESFEVDSNYTEESYYQEMLPQTPARKSLRSSIRVSMDPIEIIPEKQNRGFNIDMLKDKEYFEVLKMLGAIPKDSPIKSLKEEATARNLENWFESSPSIKRNEASSPSPTYRKQATQGLLKRMKTAQLSDLNEESEENS